MFGRKQTHAGEDPRIVVGEKAPEKSKHVKANPYAPITDSEMVPFVPELIEARKARALERIADALERANELPR